MGETDYCAPGNHGDKELAVVFTGTDSGFGYKAALRAAEAGYVVFAGVLKKESLDSFKDNTNIFPLLMDVTKDEDIIKVVKTVQDWMQDESGKKRVLHALLNNAGICVFTNTDWTDLATMQKVMDGKLSLVVRVY